MARPSEQSRIVEALASIRVGVARAPPTRSHVAPRSPRPGLLALALDARALLLPCLRSLRPTEQPLAEHVLRQRLPRRVQALRARDHQLLLDIRRDRCHGGVLGAQRPEILLVAPINHMAHHLGDLRLRLARRAIRVKFRDLPDVAAEKDVLLLLLLPTLALGLGVGIGALAPAALQAIKSLAKLSIFGSEGAELAIAAGRSGLLLDLVLGLAFRLGLGLLLGFRFRGFLGLDLPAFGLLLLLGLDGLFRLLGVSRLPVGCHAVLHPLTGDQSGCPVTWGGRMRQACINIW